MAETDIKSINKRAIHDTKAREDIETLNSQFKDIANEDLTISEGKLYIKQKDGSLKGTGIELPNTSGGKGEDGVGILSVAQTTTSVKDGGNNVITVTKTDNTTSTFIVKNGSKGDTGDKGEKGDTGSKGDKGDPGNDYILTANDKSEIAEKVNGVTLLQAPTFVDSVDKMTDTNKTYVLSTTGEIYAYMNTTTVETITKNITATTDNAYTDNARLASDGSVATGYSGYVTTPYIDLLQYPVPFTLHLDGVPYIISGSGTETYTKIATYESDKTKIQSVSCSQNTLKGQLNITDNDITVESNGNSTIVFNKEPKTNNSNNDAVLKYVKFSGKGTSTNSKIYVTYQGEVTGGHWVGTGMSYAPTITDETKTEIANMVANMIDTQMLDTIGNGEVSV